MALGWPLHDRDCDRHKDPRCAAEEEEEESEEEEVEQQQQHGAAGYRPRRG